MNRVCRLIPNFAAGMPEDALWRPCASGRRAGHNGVFHGCQLFQEKVNLFSKGVNGSSKVSTSSGKPLSTTSGKRAKNVNRNQEKTRKGYKGYRLQGYIFPTGHRPAPPVLLSRTKALLSCTKALLSRAKALLPCASAQLPEGDCRGGCHVERIDAVRHGDTCHVVGRGNGGVGQTIALGTHDDGQPWFSDKSWVVDTD